MSTVAVITCHNYGRYLAQCLDSVLAQSVPFARAVLVDDSSSDNTAEVAGDYPAIDYLRVEYGDACLSRNAGAAAAFAAVPDAKHILFIDADNWLTDTYHEQLRATMADDPKRGFVYARLRYCDEAGEPIPEVLVPPTHKEFVQPYDYHLLRSRNFADTCSLLRREAYAATGWRSNPGGMQDWQLLLDITRKGWYGILCESAILNYRLHEGSMGSQNAENYDRVWDALRTSTRLQVTTLVNHPEQLGTLAWWYNRLDWEPSLKSILTVSREEHLPQIRKALPDARLAVCGGDMGAQMQMARVATPTNVDYVLLLGDLVEPDPLTIKRLAIGCNLRPMADGVCSTRRPDPQGPSLVPIDQLDGALAMVKAKAWRRSGPLAGRWYVERLGGYRLRE